MNPLSYRDLKVWQKGMDFAADCYRLTRDFPRDELYGMTSQLRRASASVPANIAEGYGRDSRNEYAHFLRIVQGSLKETETYLLLAARVGLTVESAAKPALELADEIGRMLRGLIRSLTSASPAPLTSPKP
jgi:four helix bundle protein